MPAKKTKTKTKARRNPNTGAKTFALPAGRGSIVIRRNGEVIYRAPRKKKTNPKRRPARRTKR